jgi:4-amino-4-deoxy-L-arabinose transferase-like glycosyltransferase
LSRLKVFFIVLLMWAAMYLPALGTRELRGEEARRIFPALAMLKTGDWLMPHIGGEAYHRKPPFINWLIAGSFISTHEQSELSARLPSALAILAFVSLLIWVRGDWLSLEARLVAAIIFLSSLGVIDKGRLIELEAIYLGLTSMAVFTWWNMWARGGSAWTLWLAPSVFLAASMLTKGPAILVFYYVPIVCILAYAGRLRAMWSRAHLVAVVVSLSLPLLWMLLAWHRGGDPVVTDMSADLAIRLTTFHVNWGKWLSEIAVSFKYLLPWVLFAPALWKHDLVAGLPSAHLPLFKGGRLGVTIAFLAIAMIPENHGRYALPAVGALSVLLGWLLTGAVELPDRGRLWRQAVLAGCVAACLGAAFGLIAVRGGIWSAVLLCSAICLTIILVKERQALQTSVSLALVSGLLAILVTLQYAMFAPVHMHRGEVNRPLAAEVNSLVPEHETIYAFRPGYLPFLFYVREPVTYLTEPGQIDNRVRFLLVREEVYRQLKEDPRFNLRPTATLCDLTYTHRGVVRLIQLSPMVYRRDLD